MFEMTGGSVTGVVITRSVSDEKSDALLVFRENSKKIEKCLFRSFNGWGIMMLTIAG
jgi:hypothetical protein